jgi:phage prohead protease, HK97 family
VELRTIKTPVTLRNEDNEESRTIEGYALKFNTRSEPLAGNYFIETLDRSCLDDTDMSNVVVTFNHDQSNVLGRTGVNLDLYVDDTGLRFKANLPNTTLANDVLENIRAGIVSKCSFAFTLPDDSNADEWKRVNDDGVQFERTIRKIDKLYDVSVVTTPAYSDTNVSVDARSMDKVKELQTDSLNSVREQQRKDDLRKLNIELLKEVTD